MLGPLLGLRFRLWTLAHTLGWTPTNRGWLGQLNLVLSCLLVLLLALPLPLVLLLKALPLLLVLLRQVLPLLLLLLLLVLHRAGLPLPLLLLLLRRLVIPLPKLLSEAVAVQTLQPPLPQVTL